MALTSGFYNSIDGDRTYDAEQMSSIFEGIIRDGVLMGIGNMFSVRVANETKAWLNIGTGRAWFNGKWINNDSVGIVALEDIVEEIIGEIEAEHDISSYECRKTNDGGYLVSARLEIERVNEALGLGLPEGDDYKTVGGLILDRYQSFPKLNEVIAIDGWNCKILKNTETKIELVKFTKAKEEE